MKKITKMWAITDKENNILYAVPNWRVVDSMRMPLDSKLVFIKCSIMTPREVALYAKKERK